MKFKLMLLPTLLLCACHNTNPDTGSGSNPVERHTTLSNQSIVDSAKSIVDKSYSLQLQLNRGMINDEEFKKANTALTVDFQSLYKSLAPADTLIIQQYKLEKEKSMQEKTKKTNQSQVWE